MSLGAILAQQVVGALAEALVKEVVDLLDGDISDEEKRILTAFTRKLRTAPANERSELLRRVALEIGYERLAEASMDAALKAARKL